jgi:hypothetical protein
MLLLSLNVFVILCALLSPGLSDAAPKVLSMRMYRQEQNTLQKRAPLSVTLGNAWRDFLYYVNATVGTPPQEVRLQIDTGSSDVWMFGPDSCDSSTSTCLGGACKSMNVSIFLLNTDEIFFGLLALLYSRCG